METDIGKLDYYAGVTGVGFSTIQINNISPQETIQMPTDIVNILEEDIGSEFIILASRERSDPLDPIRSDPEEMIARSFTIPWERDFYLNGDVRFSTDTDSSTIDELLGIGKVSLTASTSLSGDLNSSPRSAFDSNLDTAWRTGIGNPIDSFLIYETEEEQNYDNISITYITDGNHSVPRRITLYADDIALSSVSTPGKILGETSKTETVTFENAPFQAKRISLNFDEVANRTTMDWYSGLPQIMPLGVIEVSGVPTNTQLADY